MTQRSAASAAANMSQVCACVSHVRARLTCNLDTRASTHARKYYRHDAISPLLCANVDGAAQRGTQLITVHRRHAHGMRDCVRVCVVAVPAHVRVQVFGVRVLVS